MVQSSKIKRLLRDAGIPARSAAEQMGIAESTLSLKLAGQRPWRPEELVHVRDILAGAGLPTSMDDFFTPNEAA